MRSILRKSNRRRAQSRRPWNKSRLDSSNGDFVRNMSDLQLANFIGGIASQEIDLLYENCLVVLRWLQEPYLPHEAVCRVCGRTGIAACEDDWYWAEPDLCSECFEVELEALDGELEAQWLREYADIVMEDMLYLADHTSPCEVCQKVTTDKCNGAENSSCFEWRGPK